VNEIQQNNSSLEQQGMTLEYLKTVVSDLNNLA
jgi:hypothetical protein